MEIDNEKEKDIGNPNNLKFFNDIIMNIGDTDPSWLSLLELQKDGTLKKMLNNYILILQNHPAFKCKIKYNKFAYRIDKVAEILDMEIGAWTDTDTLSFRQWLNQNFKSDASNEILNDAVLRFASLNSYHPIKNYIKSLSWDGVERLNTWILNFLNPEVKNTKHEVYIQKVSSLFLGAAIKRIFEPGCKVDNIFLFQGRQGIGKSLTMQMLAIKPEWFANVYMSDITNKDIFIMLRGKWIIEFPEMYSFHRSKNEAIKQFITSQVDTYRPPYGRNSQDFPRQSIFVATTNQYEHHDDETGYRRFLPISLTDNIKIDELKEVIPQLYAEAYTYYLKDHFDRLYIDDSESIEVAYQEQMNCMFDDPWMPEIEEFLLVRDKTTIIEIMERILNFHDKKDQSKTNQMRISKILRLLGYAKKTSWENGKTVKVWEKGGKGGKVVRDEFGTI